MCLCWEGGWMGRGVWMGVGRPCPPVHNDIVSPRHLFFFLSRAQRLRKLFFWSIRPCVGPSVRPFFSCIMNELR